MKDMPVTQSKKTNQPVRRWLDFLLLIPLVAWAVGFCYASGMRGFFALDQSIVFDGAWRVLNGQIPYRDFLLPYGPVVLWLQAAIFGMFGVTYQVYVLTAAVLNACGVVLTYGLIRVLIPERRWLSVLTSLLTGTWLYAPMGTPYPEQTGFIFILAAVSAVIFGAASSRTLRWTFLYFAGASLALALLCKTNAGLFGIPVVLGLVSFRDSRPINSVLGDLTAAGLGMVTVLAGFAGWLFTLSDPAAFRLAVLERAGGEGVIRLLGSGIGPTLFNLLTGKGNDLVRIVTISSLSLLVLGLGSVLGSQLVASPEAKRLRLLTLLALLLAGYQNLFSISSSNNGANEVPFVALIWACGVAGVFCVRRIRQTRRNAHRHVNASWGLLLVLAAFCATLAAWARAKNMDLVAGTVLGALAAKICCWDRAPNLVPANVEARGNTVTIRAFCLAFVALVLLGGGVGLRRQVQDVFNLKTRYIAHCSIPALNGLQWAINTKQDTAHANWEDFENVLEDLKRDKGRFFVAGDYSIFYGLTGCLSMGPLLWFHKGLTYPVQYDQTIDAQFAKAISEPDVTQLVVEDQLFTGSRPMDDFALLRNAVAEQFHPSHRHGAFQMYARNQSTPEIGDRWKGTLAP